MTTSMARVNQASTGLILDISMGQRMAESIGLKAAIFMVQRIMGNSGLMVLISMVHPKPCPGLNNPIADLKNTVQR